MIDLNRYSNSVARRIINAYNDIILDSVNKLRAIDDLDESFKAARLRSIIGQLKESLATWAGDSIELTALELQGLAELQSEFVEEQLKKVLPRSIAISCGEISPQFAQSVVVTDPTQINVVALSDDLFAAVQALQTFSLTAAEGATITLPNGQVVQKAFRGIAEDQAELFGQVVRQGLLTGETTDEIANRLKGRLRYKQPGSVKQIAAKGGQVTTVANNQVVALVRTSINQVANAASQQVYEANQDITKKYRYIATLDSQFCHFVHWMAENLNTARVRNHRNTSTVAATVAVIDHDNLPFDPPPTGKRAAQGGMVPADQSYAFCWLNNQKQQKQKHWENLKFHILRDLR